MENTGYIALSRQDALWRQLETVANNMANANTPAYKSQRLLFSDHLVEVPTSDGTKTEIEFVEDRGTWRDMSAGPLTKTDAPLDVALNSDGFFVVDTEMGPRYTRSGHFTLDADGMLVTPAGDKVMQTGDLPIVFAPNERQISIARDGTVSTENGVIAKLNVVRFDNQQALEPAGGGLYATDAQAQPVERADMVQGMLEDSNVQPVVEMTSMISILRNYQGVQKMLDAEHERQLKAMQVLSQANKA